MATITVNSTAGGATIPYELVGDSLIVGQSGLVYSTNNYAITGTVGDQSVLVAGVVSASQAGYDGIYLVNSTATGFKVVVAASGYVSGQDDAIAIDGVSAVVENHGTIVGSFGLFLGSTTTATTSTVLNTGTISTKFIAINTMSTGSSISLVNEGLIIGGTDSFGGGALVDTVDNSGVMRGDIFLQGGDDIYTGTHGRVVGTIFGGDGDDKFKVGAFVETIDGGADDDTLDYSATAGVKVALDNSFANTGVAAGDVYTNMEILLGSNTGADYLRGNNSGNGILGNGGNDTLQGMGGIDEIGGGDGDDKLYGGTGNDFLAGNAGADRFYFDTALNGTTNVDTISTVSSLDKIVLDNDIFTALGKSFTSDEFRSIATGTSFGSVDSTDNVIYLKSVGELYYDADGSGAAARVLFAELTPGASLSFAQFTLIE